MTEVAQCFYCRAIDDCKYFNLRYSGCTRVIFTLMGGDTTSGNFSVVTLQLSSPKPLSSDKLIEYIKKWIFIMIVSIKGSTLSGSGICPPPKLEITDDIILPLAFVPARNIYLFIGHQVFHHFQKFFPLLYFETKASINDSYKEIHDQQEKVFRGAYR